MTATDVASNAPRGPGVLARWWRRWQAQRRRIDYAAWDLRERYGEAALAIARASARTSAGDRQREFWGKVAARLRG